MSRDQYSMNKHDSSGSKNSNDAPLDRQNCIATDSSSAERLRLWHLNRATGQHMSPVALPIELLSLKNWGRKPLRQAFNGHSLSLELRFYFLCLYHLVKNTAGWKLGFITVNFSQSVTDRISREAARAPATCYADMINKRLRKRGVDARWFCVLEDHQGNLHSHCVIAYRQDDEQLVKACFKQDTALMNSGYRLQHSYKQRCKAMSKASIQSQVFTHADCLGKYRNAEVDVGVADYLSKALEKTSSYMDAGKARIYAAKSLRAEASQRYELARSQQQRLSSRNQDLSDLSCHQAMTYLYHGWIPKVDPEDDQRGEQQASEIDELMAWTDFRNSSPAYDWQYEEVDPESAACQEVERFMAAETSEQDYEQTVLAAGAAWDNEQLSRGPSEREYDRIVSEAVFQARNEWKASQPTEREYDQLMAEVDAILEHQRWTQCFPYEIEPDVSDDEVEPIVRRERQSVFVELVAEHRDTLSADRPYPPPLDATWTPNDAVMASVRTPPDPARTVDHLEHPGDGSGHTASFHVLSSTLQNSRRRPCERLERRGIARQCTNAETPLRRSLTRYSASPMQFISPLDHRCLGPPQ